MQNIEGRARVIIEGVKPELDGGRFPIKRVAGESVVVEADVFTDGHDTITVMLWHRRKNEKKWVDSPMRFLVNDRWRGEFVVSEFGRYEYTICRLLRNGPRAGPRRDRRRWSRRPHPQGERCAALRPHRRGRA